MKKFAWNKVDTRNASSLLFIAAATGMVLLTSGFYYFNSNKAQRQTLSTKAATQPAEQCLTTTAEIKDKCSQGIFPQNVCQFMRDASNKTAWTNFILSGNPDIRPYDYGNDGGDPASIRLDSKDGKPFSGGVYYTFPTTPGKTYCGSWRWGPNTNTTGRPNAFTRTLGLDPTGGTNAGAGSVQWSNGESRVGRHLDYPLNKIPGDLNVDKKIVASGNTMTIFLKGDFNASEQSFLLMDMVNVYDEGSGGVIPPTATPTPASNPVDSITCPTTSTQSYALAAINASNPADRQPANEHPDKNLTVRGYQQITDDPALMVVRDYTDPKRDYSAPQLTTVTDNRDVPFYHLYQVNDWKWGNPWGTRGSPLVEDTNNNPPKSYGVTAAGFFASAGSNVYVPNSGYNVGGGHQAYVLYADNDRLTLVYGNQDTAANGYVIHLENFCVDPNLVKKYFDSSLGRSQLPVLDGGQYVGKFKTKELIVAVRDTGRFMDPRSVAWWQGRPTGVPPAATATPVPQCPVPPDTTGMQATRNATGDKITLAWDPNGGSNGFPVTGYTLWVDDQTDIPWDGSCSSAAGDFCADITSTSFTFDAKPDHPYEWTVHSKNACGQIKTQKGPYIVAMANPPTATPSPTSTPACIPAKKPAGLQFTCDVGALSNKATLEWTADASVTNYEFQLDNLSDPWDGSCTSTGGDSCKSGLTTKYIYDIGYADTFTWRVRGINACNPSDWVSGKSFRCTYPTTINTPTPASLTGTPTPISSTAPLATNTPTNTPTPTATPTPAPRYADCNKCGYCSNKTKQPGNLEACMACLYPDTPVADIQKTLFVDPTTNQPPAPRVGAYFSQLGCVDVGITGFKDPAAAGGVLNIILNRLLFPITGVLALLSLIYGAFLLITAQDNPEQIGRGKRWIYGAIVGLVFTFMSILLIRMVAGDVLKIPGFDL
ncbi:hypothetical protein BH09PAT2_BH09PAT2_02340 [soil metagenome]